MGQSRSPTLAPHSRRYFKRTGRGHQVGDIREGFPLSSTPVPHFLVGPPAASFPPASHKGPWGLGSEGAPLTTPLPCTGVRSPLPTPRAACSCPHILAALANLLFMQQVPGERTACFHPRPLPPRPSSTLPDTAPVCEERSGHVELRPPLAWGSWGGASTPASRSPSLPPPVLRGSAAFGVSPFGWG